MNDAIVVIPARMNASRLPGKPLIKIAGIELIKRCYLNAVKAVGSANVFLAGCDDAIEQFCNDQGFNYLQTSSSIERAIDRVAEAVELNPHVLPSKDAAVVMLQGDEPFITSDYISQCIEAFKRHNVGVLNLVCRTNARELFIDTNVVKAVVSITGRVLYLSRHPLVFEGPAGVHSVYVQTGLIVFSEDALSKFSGLKQGGYERTESIDINRLIEHDFPVFAEFSNELFISIDTPQDVTSAEKFVGLH